MLLMDMLAAPLFPPYDFLKTTTAVTGSTTFMQTECTIECREVMSSPCSQ